VRETRCKVAIRSWAAGGASTFDSEMIRAADMSLPYKRPLASSSGRRVEPSRDTPANTPRARE